MLELLRINNVALIDEIEINFCNGLNILSGETGAGKSIIIDAIGFVLGSRADKDFVRNGQSSAKVEALFYVDNKEATLRLEELGIETNEDKQLLLSRLITSDGRSTARINGRIVSTAILKELSSSIIDIHSQHQSLLNPGRHTVLLDRFCGASIIELKARLSEYHKNYKETLRSISQISQSPEETELKIELYTHQIKEIEDANFATDEEERLLEQRKVLSNVENLSLAANKILDLMYDGDNSVLDKLSSALNFMEDLSDYNTLLSEMSETLSSSYADLEDLTREFRRFAQSLPTGKESLDEIEERLDTLYRLKKKYGRSINEIQQFYNLTKNKLNSLLNSGEEIERLNTLLSSIKKDSLEICSLITQKRKEAASKIKIQIENVLKDLGMENAKFSIEITPKEDFSPDGLDKIEFLISPNQGEPLKPLSKIASGGEMSRIMLAMKTVLSQYDSIETFIFDEIDAGVSGRAAQMVAQKLAFLAKRHQILSITHLPQIAAMGDANFLIKKISDDQKTLTTVTRLDSHGITNELARLTSGAEITSSTLAAASEMKSLADAFKDRGTPPHTPQGAPPYGPEVRSHPR